MSRGRFISIEGGEGVGKSTQIASLAKAIREHGHEVIITRDGFQEPKRCCSRRREAIMSSDLSSLP
jgi:thymidylate kinase